MFIECWLEIHALYQPLYMHCLIESSKHFVKQVLQLVSFPNAKTEAPRVWKLSQAIQQLCSNRSWLQNNLLLFFIMPAFLWEGLK